MYIYTLCVFSCLFDMIWGSVFFVLYLIGRNARFFSQNFSAAVFPSLSMFRINSAHISRLRPRFPAHLPLNPKLPHPCRPPLSFENSALLTERNTCTFVPNVLLYV